MGTEELQLWLCVDAEVRRPAFVLAIPCSVELSTYFNFFLLLLLLDDMTTTQIIDDEEKVAPGAGTTSDNHKKSVRFMDDDTSAANSHGDSVILFQSIGHGQIVSFSNLQHQQLSAGGGVAINSFTEQSSAEQNKTASLFDQIESPQETTQYEGETWEENGTTAPLNSAIGDIDDNKVGNGLKRRRSSMHRRKEKPWKYQKFPLPESTYTFFITENILSVSAVVGVITVAISLTALAITFKYELDKAENGNPYGMPPGVVTEVRIAQFLGAVIGEYPMIISSLFLCSECILFFFT